MVLSLPCYCSRTLRDYIALNLSLGHQSFQGGLHGSMWLQCKVIIVYRSSLRVILVSWAILPLALIHSHFCQTTAHAHFCCMFFYPMSMCSFEWMFASTASCTYALTFSVSVLSQIPEFFVQHCIMQDFIWIEAWWNGPCIFTFTFARTYGHTKKVVFCWPRLNPTIISPVCHVSWSFCWASMGTDYVHHNKARKQHCLTHLAVSRSNSWWTVTSCVSEAVDAAGLDASSLHACIADVAQEMGWLAVHMGQNPDLLIHLPKTHWTLSSSHQQQGFDLFF